MEIKSLSGTSFEELAGAFGEAFAEYEVQITPDELRAMLRRRGFDAGLSFAAFDGGSGGCSGAGSASGGRIAGFTLNGIGTFSGVRTAYDTGTGTLPEYRGQGLATRIFEESLPALRSAGVKQYLLEVLQHNTVAAGVYRRLGFEVSREFGYYRAVAGDVRVGNSLCQVQCVGVADVQRLAAEFWDFEPSWQNSFEAVERAADDFVIFGAYDGSSGDASGGDLVGYGIFEPATGDITQIAVAKTHRRRGIGTALLGEMMQRNRAPGVKCINTEIGRDEALAAFLTARGITLAGKQFEMIKRL